MNAESSKEEFLSDDHYMLLRREVLSGGKSKAPTERYCLMDEDCDMFDAPYYCSLVTGKCHPSREEGDYCGAKQTCFRGLVCHNGRCRNETSYFPTETCTQNRDCAYADYCHIQAGQTTGACKPFERHEYCPRMVSTPVDLEGGCYPDNICVYQLPETVSITSMDSYDNTAPFEQRGVCLRRCQVFTNSTALSSREEAMRTLLGCPNGFTCITDWHLGAEGYYMVHGKRIPASEQVMALIRMRMGFCLPDDAVEAFRADRAHISGEHGLWKILGLVSFFILLLVFGSAILMYVFRHRFKRKPPVIDPSAPPEYPETYDTLIHALGPSAPPPPAYHMILESEAGASEVVFDDSCSVKSLKKTQSDDIFT